MSKWHPREHRKALDGMLMLTLEERGAYNTCLDLIYDREGPIPDDARWLAGWMGVTPRKWAMVRAALIVKGKLFEVLVNTVPSLMNERAAIELENQSERSRNSAENGAKGGKRTTETRANTSKNNAEAQATAAPTLKLVTSTETGTKNPPDEPKGSPAPQGADKGRGTRIPENWSPDFEAAGKVGLPQDEAQIEADKFLDYWRAVPGAKGRKADWPATWRVWCRNAMQRKPQNRAPHERPNASQKFLDNQANLARAFAGSERAAGRDWKP